MVARHEDELPAGSGDAEASALTLEEGPQFSEVLCLVRHEDRVVIAVGEPDQAGGSSCGGVITLCVLDGDELVVLGVQEERWPAVVAEDCRVIDASVKLCFERGEVYFVRGDPQRQALVYIMDSAFDNQAGTLGETAHPFHRKDRTD